MLGVRGKGGFYFYPWLFFGGPWQTLLERDLSE